MTSDTGGTPHLLTWNGGLDGHLRLRPAGFDVEQGLYRFDETATAIAEGWIRPSSRVAVAAAFALVQHLAAQLEQFPAATPAGELDPAFHLAARELLALAPANAHLHTAIMRQRDCFDQHQARLAADEQTARTLLEAKRIATEHLALHKRLAQLAKAILPGDGCRVLVRDLPERQPYLHRGAKAVDTVTPVTAMRDGALDIIFCGADWISGDGVAAIRRGGHALVITACQLGVPCWICTPSSGVVAASREGDIPIHGDQELVPLDLVAGLITEAGIVDGDYPAAIQTHFGAGPTPPAI